jgi:hypothetical protein
MSARVIMAKKTIALVLAFLVLVWGVKYYQDHYVSQSRSNQKPSITLDAFDSPIIINPPANNLPDVSLKLGVYTNSPSNSTSKPSQSINWSAAAPLYPGQSRNCLIYVRNEGNTPVNLTLSTSNWSFQDSDGTELSLGYRQYFNLAWNYDNSTITVDEVKPITLALTVSPFIMHVTRFFFSIIINMQKV